MSKYGVLTCPDCGVLVERLSPNMKRCKPCAMKSVGMTGNGYNERECRVCHASYKPTASSQVVCAACRPAYRASTNLAHQMQLRRDEGAPPRGSEKACTDCGQPFPYRSGPQHRCPACQKARALALVREANARSPHKRRYRKTAVDNYHFGGNRAATLERDGGKCRKCGTSDTLHVHHIDGWGMGFARELRNNSLDNLITLCKVCHARAHAFNEHGMYERHRETVVALFNEFLHSS
jgi:5-methylcytosine-specific restriction endonuclease McrA